MIDLERETTADLLRLHARVEAELRRREVLRTGNGPVGDYAEHLFRRAYGWALEANSKAGYDAVDASGNRYQIKGRREAAGTKSRQLSAIRNLAAGDFDFLAAVLFDEHYGVSRAIVLPRSVVLLRASYSAHTNSHILILSDALWALPEARDVTPDLIRAAP
ncbi:hypothetical protein [Pinisolibacter sp.]|uniref:hypothetical protein n=1 Tax=Pinisolibacter sp. TaxID=2172024 RepID=UPI002FDDDC78